MATRDWYCEDVLSGKIDVNKLREDDLVLAFHHPEPHPGIHVVVIPKKHVPFILDRSTLDGALFTSMVRPSKKLLKASTSTRPVFTFGPMRPLQASLHTCTVIFTNPGIP